MTVGRYVTPTGVEIEMGDEAAAVIGYKPVTKAKTPTKSAPKKSTQPEPTDEK